MKRYAKREVEVEITSEIGEIVGFETSDARKGTLVYVGLTGHLHAIVCDGGSFGVPNSSCGLFSENKFLLEVNENNIKALKLYKKIGFEEISKRKNYYGKNEDAIIMMKYH